MLNLALVAIGGALGAAARYGLSLTLMARTGAAFPWATFAINVSGSLLIGLLAGFVAGREEHEPMRLLLGVGVLGGFTTFSAFSLETAQLIERGEIAPAFGYAAGSVLAGLAACFIGLMIARRVFA